MSRAGGFLGTMRAPADTRHKQHSHLAARGEHLGIVPGAADHLRRLDATILRSPRQERAKLALHRDRWSLLQRANVGAKRALAGDGGAQGADPILERAARLEIG